MTAGDLDGWLPAPWFAARFGLDPVALEARRRAGELVATRPAGSADWLYAGWQLDDRGEVRPDVRRVLDAARESGMTPRDVDEFLRRRVGLAGRQTYAGLLAAGNGDAVVAAIRRGD